MVVRLCPTDMQQPWQWDGMEREDAMHRGSGYVHGVGRWRRHGWVVLSDDVVRLGRGLGLAEEKVLRMVRTREGLPDFRWQQQQDQLVGSGCSKEQQSVNHGWCGTKLDPWPRDLWRYRRRAAEWAVHRNRVLRR
ncbi:hypothetical protein CCHR01_05426 [Colletotrichum chrysophilum]|uniref:Uncharacterized protein n=1 Tax=Colletotrichum chrysophilum TaxID=1836956 RepID=A0AAD9ELJ1_9PEZI|nr:hypothetical protein CCHR01_05426 [Colletotrichum chrysophilum]